MTFPVIYRPPLVSGTSGVVVPDPTPTLILDQLSTSTLIALSFARRLTGTYTGPLIRVRRSSDDTEQDIGYGADNNLDTVALLAFAGAGDAYVSKLYDQSGNAYNAEQPTPEFQPTIVDVGSVVTTIGGKPCGSFNGTDDHLVTSADLDTVVDPTNWCAFAIARFETVDGGFFTVPVNAPAIAGGYNPPGGGNWVMAAQHFAFSDFYSYDGSHDIIGSNVAYVQPRSQRVYVFWRDDGAGTMYCWDNDGTNSSGATGVRVATPGTKLGIGAHYGAPTDFIDGQITEFISFVSVPSLADRNTLGADQAALSGVTWTNMT